MILPVCFSWACAPLWIHAITREAGSQAEEAAIPADKKAKHMLKHKRWCSVEETETDCVISHGKFIFNYPFFLSHRVYSLHLVWLCCCSKWCLLACWFLMSVIRWVGGGGRMKMKKVMDILGAAAAAAVWEKQWSHVESCFHHLGFKFNLTLTHSTRSLHLL